jgi:hypothetical protein
MKKSDRRVGREQSGQQQLWLPLRELVREALFDMGDLFCTAVPEVIGRIAPKAKRLPSV